MFADSRENSKDMPGGAGSRDPIDPNNELSRRTASALYTDDVTAHDNDSDEATMTMAGEGGLRRRKVIHAARETIDKGE